MPRLPRYEVYPSKGSWFWRMVAGNGEILCSGEAHTRKEDAERAVRRIRVLAPIARIVEGTN